jgi:CubicO group peptidase (beta-lactamase class C family)
LKVEGYCDSKFLEVRDLFQKSFDSGFEFGAAIAIEVEGEMVIDLWGGRVSKNSKELWKKDTIVNVFSTTKGIAAICFLKLLEEGSVNLDDPVSKHWPEFSQGGKESIPVRFLLSHQSGLCGIKKPLPSGAWTDWNLITTSLAEQEPWWIPGSRHGYHALSYGHLVGELVRRISGKSIGTYFKENIQEPLELDFWIGLPDDKFDRVTNILKAETPIVDFFMPILKKIPQMPFYPPYLKILLNFFDSNTPQGSAFSNPEFNIEYVNTKEWRNAEIPAANGHGTARALAKLYGILANGGSRDGIHILNPETIEKGRTAEVEGKDLVLANIKSKFGLGFMLGTEHISMGPGIKSFGHGGAGGSLGFSDPENKTSLGFVMNQMHPGITAWKTANDIASLVYKIRGI